MNDQTKKKDAGKPSMSLLPRAGKIAAVKAFEVGREKYGRDAWRKNPMEWSRLIDAAQRHLDALAEGEDFDPQDGQPHEGAVIACMMFLAEYRISNPELDDRFKPGDTVTVQPGETVIPINVKPECPLPGEDCGRCGSKAFERCNRAAR
jgi:hypothetical protein